MRLDPVYHGPFITPDEGARLDRTIAYLDLARLRRYRSFPLWRDEHTDPYTHLFYCAHVMGYNRFAQQLVNVTLEIYHEAREWLPLFYSAALLTAENNIDLIIEELINMPQDLAAYIVAILMEMNTDMRQQVACDFARMPYDLPDRESSRAYFHDLYGRALIKLTTLLERLAMHNLYL